MQRQKAVTAYLLCERLLSFQALVLHANHSSISWLEMYLRLGLLSLSRSFVKLIRKKYQCGVSTLSV